MAQPLPFDLREAVVEVFGRAFWYKDPLRSFLVSCAVPGELYDRFSGESKFKIARHVLAELDSRGDDGFLIQRRIVTELCKLRKIPDENVPDRNAAIGALRSLKEVAIAQKVYAEEEGGAANSRAEEARRRQVALVARAKGMEKLRSTFNAMAVSRDDPQTRGYGLEDLLAELFEAHEISYRRSYKVDAEQIDGHFSYKGFDYLVEARWRSGPPVEADLGAFQMKVDGKIASTRGLFVSIVGFRPEVVSAFMRGKTSKVVLMDGQDLALVFEGQVSLGDGLDMKIEKAAQEGIIYSPLARRLSGG